MTDPKKEPSGADERKIGLGVAIGLPIATITVGALAGALVGPSMAILVFGAGTFLGTIALVWASLRVLSGDAPLPRAFEEMELVTEGVDPLESRKTMLLRALKDLENERALGKLETDDYEPIAQTYRAELKEVMRSIDASLAPLRPKAEALVRAHLVKVGLSESGYRGEGPPRSTESARERAKDTSPASQPTRIECPKCGASNEGDAKFCKECAEKFNPATKADAHAKG